MRVMWPTHALCSHLQGENVVAAQDEQSFVRNNDDLKAHFGSVPTSSSTPYMVRDLR